ncbi:MAG: LacI family DNA-binding transcriptional regulator [Burkholderiales bacterium]
MTNIQKVAQLAGVSVATVSRVINNSDKVSPGTRMKVEEAIKSLNYVPNMLARNFRTAESRSLLVMVTSISNLYYMETVHGISEYAYENGYDILLMETQQDTRRQIEGLLKVKNRIADGAIIMETTAKDDMLLSLESRHPVVQCSVYNAGAPVPFVSVDNVKGGYIGARFLIERGHRRIAFVGTESKGKYNADRLEGFLKAAAEAGIEQDGALLTRADLSFEGGGRAALELMRLEQKPTAIFFASDMQAIGAIRSLKEAGYDIPGDVAVLGFDNIEICSVVQPGLSTVAQPMREMGREAARLLIERIKTGGNIKNVIFEPSIVARGSV